MRLPIRAICLCLTIALSGCAAITVTEKGDPSFLYRPHYEQTKHFYLWGLIGEYRINTREICGARPVVQMQTLFEPLDVLFSALTLGIYLPRTAKVWCERGNG